MRVYLDTNVFGGYLRDCPEKIPEFKGAVARGYSYYTSTETTSELACNSEKSRFVAQADILRQLVADHCFYRQPKELIQSEILRLTGGGIRPLLVPAEEISRVLPSMINWYDDPKMHLERQKQFAGNAEFFRFNKSSVKAIQPHWKDLIELPDDFQTHWAKYSSSNEMESMMESICRMYAWVPTAEQVKQVCAGLSVCKALSVCAISFQLFPYSQLMRRQHPNKGDGMDLRHAVAAAYCDIFVSRDANFRNYLNMAAGVLPYKIMSPEEFLVASKLPSGRVG